MLLFKYTYEKHPWKATIRNVCLFTLMACEHTARTDGVLIQILRSVMGDITGYQWSVVVILS